MGNKFPDFLPSFLYSHDQGRGTEEADRGAVLHRMQFENAAGTQVLFTSIETT